MTLHVFSSAMIRSGSTWDGPFVSRLNPWCREPHWPRSSIHSSCPTPLGETQAEIRPALDAADGVNKVRFCEPNEASNKVLRAVTLADFGEPVSDRNGITVRGCGHVAVGERVPEWLVDRGELAGESIIEAALFGLDDGAGVAGHKTAEDVIGVGHVAEVAGSVKRVKACVGDLRAVADVVQPCRSFEQVGVVTENGCKRAGLPGDTLSVCPATRKRLS